MEGWKGWMSFNFKRSFLLPTKGMLVKVTSLLRYKAEEKRHGLLSLYQDMEACAGYADIQVMWEMVHSSCPPNAHNNRSSKRPSQWTFCFRPT